MNFDEKDLMPSTTVFHGIVPVVVERKEEGKEYHVQ